MNFKTQPFEAIFVHEEGDLDFTPRAFLSPYPLT